MLKSKDFLFRQNCLTRNWLSLILRAVTMDVSNLRETAFFQSGAMSHGIIKACTQAGVAVMMQASCR